VFITKILSKDMSLDKEVHIKSWKSTGSELRILWTADPYPVGRGLFLFSACSLAHRFVFRYSQLLFVPLLSRSFRFPKELSGLLKCY